MSAIDATALLRAAELRVTRPRVAVLSMVADNPHSDTDTIATAVRRDLGSVSTQAVYDVLRALTEAGLVRRIEPAGSPARFETRVGDDHHHLVCRACGAITDVSSAVGEAPCLAVQDSRGFDLDETEVIFWGSCPDCLARGE
ncbi:Fur family transcriptional regulator [Saccharopolyspora gloriosae]|uniref:Fur family transcriptional regulator n=1 Tax=Saccharopolyspora gloriosae TaxID=455344 RepID=UPI001FB85B08|nr:Fur family transcriptional regulator [Saccharopolyspora gloriosae]